MIYALATIAGTMVGAVVQFAAGPFAVPVLTVIVLGLLFYRWKSRT